MIKHELFSIAEVIFLERRFNIMTLNLSFTSFVLSNWNDATSLFFVRYNTFIRKVHVHKEKI